MIGTIASTPMADTIIAITHQTRNTRNCPALKRKKGEPGGSPSLRICCVVSEARELHVCFASDAHRKSGVFSFDAALSPVES